MDCAGEDAGGSNERDERKARRWQAVASGERVMDVRNQIQSLGFVF